MDKPEKRKATYVPHVHKEFPNLGNEHNCLKVRIVQYNHPYFGESAPRLDIRKFLTNHANRDGTTYTGFTKEGISLSWDDLQLLVEMWPQIIEAMDQIPERATKKPRE